jgi:uncharacterized phiE125 gp8 family phage protein
MSRMRFSTATAATTYPVSLTEFKNHLRIDSGTIADDLSSTPCIAPGSHGVAASYSLKGTGVSVAGTEALVAFTSGTNGTSGTVDVKIQESDTDSDAAYTDWTGGAFTQVTTSNDNATYEKEYTGTKAYIRVVVTVGTAACEFGVNVIKRILTRTDDDYITACLAAATGYTEQLCGPLVSATFDGYLDEFPSGDIITITKPRCSAVTSIKYTDDDGVTQSTFSSSYYVTDFVSFYARIRLKDGYSWPSDTLTEVNGVVIRFTAGYTNAAAVPYELKAAVQLLGAHLYNNRELSTMRDQSYTLPMGYDSLIANYRDWGTGE